MNPLLKITIASILSLGKPMVGPKLPFLEAKEKLGLVLSPANSNVKANAGRYLSIGFVVCTLNQVSAF